MTNGFSVCNVVSHKSRPCRVGTAKARIRLFTSVPSPVALERTRPTEDLAGVKPQKRLIVAVQQMFKYMPMPVLCISWCKASYRNDKPTAVPPDWKSCQSEQLKLVTAVTWDTTFHLCMTRHKTEREKIIWVEEAHHCCITAPPGKQQTTQQMLFRPKTQD